MTKKVGVDMGGTWLRVGVVEAEANGGRIGPVRKDPTPAAWDDLIGLLAPFDDADTEGFGMANSVCEKTP